MTPEGYLLLITGITLFAAIGWRIVWLFRRRRMRCAATHWRLRYCPADQFRLAARLAMDFPIAGAGNLHVLDLMYGGDTAVYRYLFTVEFTVGPMRARKRQRRVVQLTEPRGPGAAQLTLRLAPDDRPLLEQYRYFALPGDADEEGEPYAG